MSETDARTKGIKYVQATITDTAVTLAEITGLTAVMVAATKVVTLTVRANSINVTWTGDVPTTSTGHNITTSFVLYGQLNAAALRLIRNGSSNATVDITLEG